MTPSEQVRALAAELTSQTSILPSHVESVAARLNAIADDMAKPAADPEDMADEDEALAALTPPPATPAEPPAGTPLTDAERAANGLEPATIAPSTAPNVEVPVPATPPETLGQEFVQGAEKLLKELGIHADPS